MNKKGFTLIELLIVVAIIGIIAAIAIPNLLVALQKGKQKATMGDLKTIGTGIESYLTDWAIVPQDDKFLTETADNYFQPFYIKIVPKKDGWGHQFNYNHDSGDTYSVYSSGRGAYLATLTVPTPALYMCTALADFDKDIAYSNGYFTVGPDVKK